MTFSSCSDGPGPSSTSRLGLRFANMHPPSAPTLALRVCCQVVAILGLLACLPAGRREVAYFAVHFIARLSRAYPLYAVQIAQGRRLKGDVPGPLVPLGHLGAPI